MKDFWNGRYSEKDFAYGLVPNDLLREFAHMIPNGGKVLCIAEGEGRNSLFLAKHGYQVTGVDFSDIGMKKAREQARHENLSVQYVVADLSDYDLGNEQWDAVVSIFAHLPPPLRKRVHEKIQAGLKPGGLLILEAYRPEQLGKGTGGPQQMDMMMNLEILKNELPDLTPQLAKELERDIHEGQYHNGISSVVQFIGKK